MSTIHEKLLKSLTTLAHPLVDGTKVVEPQAVLVTAAAAAAAATVVLLAVAVHLAVATPITARFIRLVATI